MLVLGIPFLFSSSVPGNFTESARGFAYHFSLIPAFKVSKANCQEPLSNIVCREEMNGFSLQEVINNMRLIKKKMDLRIIG
jgi:hypothetical protein